METRDECFFGPAASSNLFSICQKIHGELRVAGGISLDSARMLHVLLAYPLL